MPADLPPGRKAAQRPRGLLVSGEGADRDQIAVRHHHLQEPCTEVVLADAVAICDVWHLRCEVIGFPVRGRVATPTGLLGGSLHVRTCGIAVVHRQA